jgi:hypothetical protein
LTLRRLPEDPKAALVMQANAPTGLPNKAIEAMTGLAASSARPLEDNHKVYE